MLVLSRSWWSEEWVLIVEVRSTTHFDTEQALKMETRDQPTVLSFPPPLKQISLLRYTWSKLGTLTP